jgi:hypothetical protein
VGISVGLPFSLAPAPANKKKLKGQAARAGQGQGQGHHAQACHLPSAIALQGWGWRCSAEMQNAASETQLAKFAKSPCRKLFQKFRQSFRCQFFLDFFCFIAFSGVSQRWGFKNTTKNVLQKKSCRKVFTKKSTKNPKPAFSRICFYHVFGRFSIRGGKKHDKKYRGKKTDPRPFSYSDPLTHRPPRGSPIFFLCRVPHCAGLGPLSLVACACLLRWPLAVRLVLAGLFCTPIQLASTSAKRIQGPGH